MLTDCPIFYKDFYKVGHINQYPQGTSLIFSNLTPRKSRIPGVNYAVFFGMKYFIDEYLLTRFSKYFFRESKETVMTWYRDFMKQTLGIDGKFEHIGKLHDIGYLPIAIHALPEGVRVPIKCPAFVIYNTLPEFYWLTNSLETIMSCVIWGASNSATISSLYRDILDAYAKNTSSNPGFVDYQAHDFSFRGMFGLEAAQLSGAAHLLNFKGTDTIPAINFLHKYYEADLSCGTSVPATEHSVMCAGGKDHEFETFKRHITETYPSGIVSIVSDTWDLWKVVDDYLPRLKHAIMERDGKVVIRPDSGDPTAILCGDENGTGLVQRLWDTFGGTINEKGFKELDPHIGAIYGDSITPEICNEICAMLEAQKFASTNVVFGVGSYTYQYNTRDTLGFAIKATYAEIDGQGLNIFKDPKTDDGTKKSHTGLLTVVKTENGYEVREKQTWEAFNSPLNELKLIFKDGECFGDYFSTFSDIRNRGVG